MKFQTYCLLVEEQLEVLDSFRTRTPVFFVNLAEEKSKRPMLDQDLE